jgi:predicted Zn-dependent protease
VYLGYATSGLQMSRYFAVILFAVFSGCAWQPGFFLPVVNDERLQGFLDQETAVIVRVSADSGKIPNYSVQLANFPRKDILGLSLGKQRIFISYQLTERAYQDQAYRWLLRQTIAHEVAHDVLGHAEMKSQATLNIAGPSRGIVAEDLGLRGVSIRNFSRLNELAADQKGMEYWQKLGWDCRIWVRILENFAEQNYQGDEYHPTDQRLAQARSLCSATAP